MRRLIIEDDPNSPKAQPVAPLAELPAPKRLDLEDWLWIAGLLLFVGGLWWIWRPAALLFLGAASWLCAYARGRQVRSERKAGSEQK